MTERCQPSKPAALAALGFGALSVVSGGMVLAGARDMGAVVPIVLWFNTGAGIVYMVAGVGLWQGRRWAFPLALGIFGATLLVFALLGLHVARGDPFEMRTVFAMTLRSVIWAGISLVAYRALARRAGPAADAVSHNSCSG